MEKKLIDILKIDALEMLRDLVRIPSGTGNEEAVSNMVAERFSEWNICFERYGWNIVCRQDNFDPTKRTLMLCAHLDTVAPGENYSFNPYSPVQESFADAVYGLGSNDDGGSVAALTATFRYLAGKSLPFNLILVLSVEEEKSGPNGMRKLWKENLSNFVDMAIVGEPTGMKAATAERGLIVLDCTADGISGHAAREEGVNALYKAVEDIERLRNHRFARRSDTMGDVHLAVTQINGGTAHNVVPDRCTFVVDVRPTDVYDNKALVEELQAECSSTLVARNLTHQSSSAMKDSPLVKCALDIGLETFISPTTSDWMLIDCDAIKMGPGDSARSHKKDEYLLNSELSAGIDIYIQFIQKYADTLE
ncbi:MAG: M20/M25/M40 family metallo-hydrolase [Bacteroidales bacterium]|nr:M20/M25/M40 family metallo-hydrolase [Candidatus Cacconaster merdequi]